MKDLLTNQDQLRHALLDRRQQAQRADCEKANREQIREQRRLYYATNRERINERDRLYYAANKERICERKRRWRAAKKRKENNDESV